MHERRFHGEAERLRSPERIGLLEVDRVVDLCMEAAAIESVLDVGTGSGVFAEAFAARGASVTGIDVNAELLRTALAEVPGARFREGEAESIPFSDGSFDLAFLGHVLHETDDPLGALREARRVALRRVGVLEWPYRDEERGPPLAHRVSPEVLADMARRAGYAKVERIELAHMEFYRMRP